MVFIIICTGKCPSMYFICDNGDCVPVTDKCNHVNDCLDNSDEQGCGNDSDNIIVTRYS